MRALYDEGWLATTLHPPISGWGKFEHDRWELYDLRRDRSQIHDVAAEHPDRLERLKGLWFYYAGLYKGLPLDDRNALEIMNSPRPQPSEPRNRYIYYPGTADVPESVGVNIRRRSYTVGGRRDARHVRGRGRAVRPRRGGGRAQPVHQGRPPALRLQLAGRTDRDDQRARPTADRQARAQRGVRDDGRRPADAQRRGHADAVRRHRGGRRGRDHHAAGLLLTGRGRDAAWGATAARR